MLFFVQPIVESHLRVQLEGRIVGLPATLWNGGGHEAYASAYRGECRVRLGLLVAVVQLRTIIGVRRYDRHERDHRYHVNGWQRWIVVGRIGRGSERIGRGSRWRR